MQKQIQSVRKIQLPLSDTGSESDEPYEKCTKSSLIQKVHCLEEDLKMIKEENTRLRDFIRTSKGTCVGVSNTIRPKERSIIILK